MYRRSLETPRHKAAPEAYSLTASALPFILLFAQRRNEVDVAAQGEGVQFGAATQSDGRTTSNDGSEEFDWLDDD